MVHRLGHKFTFVEAVCAHYLVAVPIKCSSGGTKIGLHGTTRKYYLCRAEPMRNYAFVDGGPADALPGMYFKSKMLDTHASGLD